MRPTPPRRTRGFTLLELLIGATASLFILAGIASAFIAIQGSYHSEAQSKRAIETSRVALGFIENELQLAGYGIDPRFAFDFETGVVGNAKDNQAGAGFWTDDLAFRYRDPTFLRLGELNGSADTVTLQPSAGGTSFDPVRSGMALLLICPGGTNWWIVRTTADPAGASIAVAPTTYGPRKVDAPPACLNDAAWVTLLRERRYRIVNLAGRNFLVRFNNFDVPDPAANADYDPLAVDVEAFQVSYVMNRGGVAPDAVGNGDWIIGNAAGETVPRANTVPDGEPEPPYFDDEYTAPSRFTNHPANIRAVRLSMVVRAPSPAPNGVRSYAPYDLENLDIANTPDEFYRTLVTSSVRTPNLLSRASFIAPLSALTNNTGCVDQGALVCDTLNVWGG